MSMRISYNNLVTASNLSLTTGASSAAPFNFENVCNGRLQPEARFTGGTSIVLKVVFPQEKRIEVSRFASHNFPDAADIALAAYNQSNVFQHSWRFNFNEKGGVVRPNYEAGDAGYHIWYLIVQNLNSTAEYRLGEWQLADAEADIELPVACTESSAEKVMLHKEKVAETEGGQYWSYSNGDIVQFPALRWQFLNPAETRTFEDLHKSCRGKKSFWLCFDDGANEVDETYFVTYLNESLKVRPSGPGYNDVEISCQEVAEGVYK